MTKDQHFKAFLKAKPKLVKKKAFSDDKLWKVFSIFIRRRDANEEGYVKCFTCSLMKHWKEMDCGHGIPRQHWGTRYNEKNNHAQCKRCNGFEGGRMDVYKMEVDKRYGSGTWDMLEVFSRISSKRPSQFDVDMMCNYFKDLTKDLDN